MSDATTDKNLSQRLITTLILSGIMVVVTVTFDAARAWLTKMELPQAGLLEFGLLIIWGVTSVLVVRRTGFIRYGILAAAIVSIFHSTVGLIVSDFIAQRQMPGFFEPPYYLIRGIQFDLFIAVVVASLAGLVWVKWLRPKKNS